MQDMKKQSKVSKAGEEGAVFDIVERCLVVRLNSELDHHNAIPIREKADKLIERNHIKHIIFDFSGVNFMDSAGIGVIMGRYKKVIFIGGKTAVTCVNTSVDRIFRLSGLYKIIDKFETVEDALQGMQTV
ncbi:MAG: hypothetical protein K0S47_2485 [Herbinix sp.]|jgi:stage II sporulation protein AA (anti-sigma F factor antagonist)|nr:hypothetical protein [Herbinix sp.]